MYLLKHLFQLDYRAAANEVEALKEENDLLRRKYVHLKDCRMFPLEISSLISCGSQKSFASGTEKAAIRHS